MTDKELAGKIVHDAQSGLAIAGMCLAHIKEYLEEGNIEEVHEHIRQGLESIQKYKTNISKLYKNHQS